MFRYGGPIKEGVMHGIREPRRDGGSMTQRVQPSNDGSRPGYAGPLLAAPVIGAGIMTAARAGLRYIPRGINYLKNLGRTRTGSTTTTVPKQGPTFPGRTTTTQGGFGAPVTTRTNPVGTGSGTIETSTYAPNILGRDPTVRLVGSIYKGITSPTATGLVQKGARLVFSPTGIVTGLYLGGKYYNKDGKETEKPKGSTIDSKKPGENSDMYYKAPEKELTLAEREKIEADNRMKQMDRYKEIMDIKGMSKDAAYKSLIDASNIIREGGNLKEGIKDGSLISKLTTAASKRFDKVSDTETALRSLVAKGEIDKEMNKEAKALARRKDELAIKTYEKTLAGDSFDEAVLKSITGTGGKMPTGNKLAGILKATRGIDSVVLDGSKVPPGGEIKFVQDSVDKKVSEGTSINPGAYVINSKIVIVDEQGNVSQYY